MQQKSFAWPMQKDREAGMASKTDGTNYDEPIAEMNVIPLVDVILVVLIIFMVTAPLVMKPTIDINLPKAASGEESTQSSLINVSITPAGELLFNGQPSSVNEINERAKALVAENPDIPAILLADKTVTLEILTQVVDAVKTAGVKKVAFSIEKK